MLDLKSFHTIQGSDSDNQFKSTNLLEIELIEQLRIFYHFVKVAKISTIDAIELMKSLNVMINNNTDQEEFKINTVHIPASNVKES